MPYFCSINLNRSTVHSYDLLVVGYSLAYTTHSKDRFIVETRSIKLIASGAIFNGLSCPGTIKLFGDRHALLHSPQYNMVHSGSPQLVHDSLNPPQSMVHFGPQCTLVPSPLYSMSMVHSSARSTPVHFSPRSSPQSIPLYSPLQFMANLVHSPLQSSSLSTVHSSPYSTAVHSNLRFTPVHGILSV